MAYAPANPYPKGRGDSIRSADWNEAVNELIRLENDKFDRSGGTVSGNLAVTGTISGTLANNIVGPNQLAANAVVTAKIADGNVTSNKLAAGAISGDRLANASVTVDKLLGSSQFTSATVTLSAAVGSISGIFVTGEFLDSTPPPAISLPLVFIASATNGAIFTHHLEFRRFLSGTRPFAGYVSWFTNQVAVATEINLSSYILRRP